MVGLASVSLRRRDIDADPGSSRLMSVTGWIPPGFPLSRLSEEAHVEALMIKVCEFEHSSAGKRGSGRLAQEAKTSLASSLTLLIELENTPFRYHFKLGLCVRKSG
jgi:hypothetical protein